MEQEIWKKIPGFSEYEVSNIGRVRSTKKLAANKNANGISYLKGNIIKSGAKCYQAFRIYNDYKIVCTVKLHRLLYQMFVGPLLEGMCIDHIDGDTLNNSLSNLRLCTFKENARNRKPNKGHPYKGVQLKEGRWRARGSSNSRKIHLGYFKTIEEAALAYNKWAIEAHGEYACLNEVII